MALTGPPINAIISLEALRLDRANLRLNIIKLLGTESNSRYQEPDELV